MRTAIAPMLQSNIICTQFSRFYNKKNSFFLFKSPKNSKRKEFSEFIFIAKEKLVKKSYS